MSLRDIKTQAELRPLRIVLHGMPGAGKTTWASKMLSCIGILTEDGLGNLAFPRFPVCDHWDKEATKDDPKVGVKQRMLELLKEDHDYKTLIIDSLDWLERLLQDHVCKENGYKNIETPGYARGHKECLVFWDEFRRLTEALRKQKGMTICMIAHSDVKVQNDPEVENFDKVILKLKPGASALLTENADCIFYITKKKGVVKSKNTTKVTQGDHVIYGEDTASYLAKNRYQLPKDLPYEWEEIRKLIIENSNGKGSEAKSNK
jgi:hypothetical protein